MEREPADAALESAVHMVSTFVIPLGRLVGDALVLQLLRERWPDGFPARAAEPEGLV